MFLTFRQLHGWDRLDLVSLTVTWKHYLRWAVMTTQWQRPWYYYGSVLHWSMAQLIRDLQQSSYMTSEWRNSERADLNSGGDVASAISHEIRENQLRHATLTLSSSSSSSQSCRWTFAV